MARTLNRMTAKQVASLKAPGRHADGGGLYLHVKPSGWRGWCYITNAGGRRREIGLGSYPTVSLADARAAAARVREAASQGRDPVTARPVASRHKTLGEVADESLATMEAGWKNDKHRAQ
jgi:hypothetical protein